MNLKKPNSPLHGRWGKGARSLFFLSIILFGCFETAHASLIGPSVQLAGLAGSDDHPSLSFDGINYILIWDTTSTGSSSLDIYAKVVNSSGAEIIPPFPVNTGPNDQSFPSISSSGTGTALAVYQSYNGTDLDIVGNLVTYSTTTTPAFTVGAFFIIAGGAGNQQYPSAAFDGTNFAVTYVDGGTAVKAVIVSKTGTPGTPITLGAVTSYAAPPSVLPQIVFSNGTIGRYLVVWEDFTSSADASGNIYGNTLTTAGVSGPVTGIAAAANFPERHPSVAFDGSNFLVVYDQGSSGSKDIYAQLVTPGLGLSGASFKVSTASNDQVTPKVAFSSGAGLYFAAWQDFRNSGTKGDIYGARIFKGGGVVEANGLAIIANTTFNTQNPVPGSDGTNFFTAWSDFRNPPTGSDIWGQLAIGPAPFISLVTPASNVSAGTTISVAGNYFGDLPAGSRATATDYLSISGSIVPDSNVTAWSNSGIAFSLPINSGSGPFQVYSGTLGSNAVSIGVQDFTMTASPTSLTVGAGQSANVTFTLTALNSFSTPVTLSASGLPTGVTASFSVNPAVPASTGTSTVMALSISPATIPGTYSIQVTGSGGGETHAVAISLGIASLPMPSTTAATNITTTSAMLNGAVNPGGVAAAAWFEYGLTSAYGSSISAGSLSAGYTSVPVSAALTGLVSGATYHFRLDASNAFGTGYGGDLIFITIAPPPVVVTGIASNRTSTSATINGTANPNGVPGTAWFQYGLTTAYGNTTPYTQINGNFDNYISYNLTGLSPYSNYHFMMIASNNGGTSYGLDSTFSTFIIPSYGTPVVELATAPANNFYGVDPYDYAGTAVALGGDINGDGLKDMVICADHATAPPLNATSLPRAYAGACYIFFGSPGGWPSPTDLGQADLVVYGANSGDMIGHSVSITGDLNGDGFSDIVIGAPSASPVYKTTTLFQAGQINVIRGRANFYLDYPNGVIDLGARPADMTINGVNTGDMIGDAVTTDGDLNGDFLKDIVFSAPQSISANGVANPGQVYIVFGTSTIFGTSNQPPINSASNADVTISGVQTGGLSSAIATGGDINGDGIADLIIGVQGYSPLSKSTGLTRYQAGGAFVFLGRKAWSANLDMTYADLTFNGMTSGDMAGSAVSLADVNGDGKADIVIGARLASPNSVSRAGSTYIVFGKSSYSSVVMDLSSADVTINGAGAGDQLGRTLSGRTDLNGDAYGDILIGAPMASPGGRLNAGSVYVLLGKSTFSSVINLATGFDSVINGATAGDAAGVSMSVGGDVNGDLAPDMLIGANMASPVIKVAPYLKKNAGIAYLLFGNNQFDTIAPSVPSGLTALQVFDNQINLVWTPSTDNVAVAGYEVYRNGNKIVTVGSAKFNDTGLVPLTKYAYQVVAFDTAGNRSALSSILYVTTLADTVPPTSPSGLTATVAGPTQINLNWLPGTDDISVAGYEVWRSTDGVHFIYIANLPGTSYSAAGLVPATLNYFYVKTLDSAGNVSNPSNTVSAITLADTAAPSVPSGLKALVLSGNEIDLYWVPSSDNVGVAGYQVFRSTDNVNFTQIATTTTASFANTGLVTIQAWYYYVKAYDVAGNVSGPSTVAFAVNDLTAPSAPASITAFSVSSGINVTWTASTDNSGFINGYQVFRSKDNVTFILAGITGGNTLGLSDTGLAATTSYYYNVKAYDLAGNLSSASPTAGPVSYSDTIAPSAPSGLAASTVTVTSVTLTWTASTDNSGVIASYQVWRSVGTSTTYAQVGTVPGNTIPLSYTDSGLLPLTTYNYYLKAVDPSGNISSASVTLSVATPADTTPPSMPANLSGTAVSETQINLSWSPSTDNVGVLGYQVTRSTAGSTFTFTTTGTAVFDPGLTAWTTYGYAVRAYDASGNYSAYSNQISMKTLDQTAPVWPVGSIVTATTAAGTVGASQINLTWSQATDNAVVAGYTVWRSSDNISFAEIASVAGATNTSYASTGLQPSLTYYYYIIAFDGAGNNSVASVKANATTTADTTPPSTPTGLVVTGLSDSRIGLSWTASTDNVAVASYNIYRVSTTTTCPAPPYQQVGFTSVSSYTDNLSLTPSTIYCYYLVAVDTSGNLSGLSSISSGTTMADTTPPTVPLGLVGFTAPSQTQVNLSWIPSTDNSGIVSGYYVFRNGVLVGTAATNSFSDTSLVANQTYKYTVQAFDPYGNKSSLSEIVAVVTDVYPPTVPCADRSAPCSSIGATSAVPSGATEIDIAWSPSKDIDLSTGGTGSGVKGYKIYRSDLTTPIGVTGASTNIFADKGLSPNTTYNYQVSAFDFAGNESGKSTAIAVSTLPDTTPPSVPQNLTGVLAAPYQINLSWAPSTDNDVVVGYKIYRNGALYMYTSSTNYADAGLSPSTTYTYTVAAYDRSGNTSGQSNSVSVTTGP